MDGCVIWLGALNNHGYGRFSSHYVHRLAYEKTVGPIPAGKELDHLCRVPACYNVGHLEAVTHAENIYRGHRPNRDVTHCPAGHGYTAENTKRSDRRRRCRKCLSRQRHERYLRLGR